MERTFRNACGKNIPMFQHRNQIISTPLGITMVHSMASLSGTAENASDNGLSAPGEKINRAILVTDDEKAAMKTAMLLTMTQEEAEEDDWDYDEFEWEDEEVCMDPYENRYAILDARAYSEDDKSIFSSFLLAEQYWNECQSYSAALFLGIEAVSDKKSYLRAVECCSKTQVFLHIPRAMENDVDVQRLVYEQNFVILHPAQRDDAYYEDLIRELLAQSTYEMFEGFDEVVFLKRCRQKWQGDCSEDRIAAVLDYAAGNAGRDGRNVVMARDFEPLLYMDKKDAYDELMSRVGLDSLKDICRRFVALELEKRRNPKAETARKHMLFYGKPGTGKTTGAAMLAKIMAEKGIGNGKFVKATRKDLIGSYVGHTAPRVAAKFEEAKGGILFVDEAGFFNQENSGGFVKEAFKEFIRYMEVYDDVTVVFAMYPEEKKQFLKLDDGMTSRIAHIVRFEDYDLGQLAAITKEMLDERGYRMPKGCEKLLEEHFGRLRANLREHFGNGRECRKLVDAIVLEISLRNAQKNVKNPDDLTLAELREVLKKSDETAEGARERYGFQAMQGISAATHM